MENFNRYYLFCNNILNTKQILYSPLGLQFTVDSSQIYAKFMQKEINITLNEFRFLLLKEFNNDLKTLRLFFALKKC